MTSPCRSKRVYSPRIPEEHIPALYRLARERKEPMTGLVARAIAEFLGREQGFKEQKEGDYEDE